MAGTQLFANTLLAAWILPFGLPALIKGDHWLLGLDFDPAILFGNKPAKPAPGLLQGINSNHKQHLEKFCKEAIDQCNHHHLAERLEHFTNLQALNDADICELEMIDSTLTKILVRADKHCRTLSDIPWSPTVQKAFIAHCYWTLCLAAFRTQRNLTSSLDALAARLPAEATAQDPTKSLSAHLKIAQKQLKIARKEAAQLRKQHLEAILNQAKAANQHKKTKAITYLIHAEHNRCCYARFRHHTKPKAPGGLAFINAPNETGTIKPILDQTEMEETLLEFSQTHFAQAKGTPFTTKPLSRLLEYDSLTTYGLKISQGRPHFE